MLHTYAHTHTRIRQTSHVLCIQYIKKPYVYVNVISDHYLLGVFSLIVVGLILQFTDARALQFAA